MQELLLKTDFVERCVTFDGGEALQIKTTDGTVFNVSSRKRDTKRSVALVNQRNPRYRRANMGLNPNLEKNLPLIKAVEERLREEKEHLERNFGRNGQTEERMVKHIVCYKFKDNSRENLDRATAALLSMRFNVPQVLSVEAGADFAGSARSYDLALAVTLKSREDLEEYQKNEFHCKEVKPVMHELTEKSVSVDFEFDQA